MGTYTIIPIFIILVIMIAADFTTDIRCPDPAQWHLRTKGFCNASFPSYVCLLDDNNNRTIETCEKQPDFQTPGYKFVIRGGYDGKPCDTDRYQPITFWTDGNSDCVFLKSKCEEEGQIYSDYGSTTSDVSCRCDNTKGYAYITTPYNPHACQPSTEDCSCYLKRCCCNMVLSEAYECVHVSYYERPGEGPTVEEEMRTESIYDRTMTKKDELELEDNPTVLLTYRTLAFLICFTNVLMILMLLGIYQCCKQVKVLMVVYHVCIPRERFSKLFTISCIYSTETKKEVLQINNTDEETAKTEMLKCLSNRLNRDNIVTVVSESDSLLTDVTSNIGALCDYHVIHSSFKITEVEQVLSGPRKRVVVIRDIFKYDTNDRKTIRRWNKVFRNITNHEYKDMKILIASKPNVFQTKIFQRCSVLFKTIFDLTIHMCSVDVNSIIDRSRSFLTPQQVTDLLTDKEKTKNELLAFLFKRYALSLNTHFYDWARKQTIHSD